MVYMLLAAQVNAAIFKKIQKHDVQHVLCLDVCKGL